MSGHPPPPYESVAGLRLDSSSTSAFSSSSGSSDFSTETAFFTDYGGGSSGSQSSSAPTMLASPTPPIPPHEGAERLQGSCSCSCRSNTNLYTFSPKTCLELLKSEKLTVEQLDYERSYMQSLGFDIDTRSRIRTSRALVENALEKQLSFHNCELIERNIRHLNTLTDNISYLCQMTKSKQWCSSLFM